MKAKAVERTFDWNSIPLHRRIPLAERIGYELNRFIDGLAVDCSIDPNLHKLSSHRCEIIQRIALACELERGALNAHKDNSFIFFGM